MNHERNMDKKALQREARNEQLHGLYFDVSKDETLVINTLVQNFLAEPKKHHYSLIQEPGSVYTGHVLPSLGCASDIAR